MKLLLLLGFHLNMKSLAFVPTIVPFSSKLSSSNIDTSFTVDDVTNFEVQTFDGDVSADAESVKYDRLRHYSFIRNIRSHNLAGFVSHNNEQHNTGNECANRDIMITLCDTANKENEDNLNWSNNLIVITGETASGKSLFTVRALEIITGKISSPQKLASYVRHSTNTEPLSTIDAFVEVEVFLVDPHLSAIEKILHHDCNLESQKTKKLQHQNRDRSERFLFRRTLQIIPINTNGKLNIDLASKQKYRMKSTCSINGDIISLKQFVALTSPLFAIVDGTIAVNAIMSNSITDGSSSCMRRTEILDTAISKQMLFKHIKAKQWYVKCRQQRLQIEREIMQQQSVFHSSSRSSRSGNADQEDMELISHYIDELDSFEERMTRFCQSLAFVEDADSLLEPSLPICHISKNLSHVTWNDDTSDGPKSTKQSRNQSTSPSANFISKMYVLLLEFRNEYKIFNDQCNTVNQIIHTLGSSAVSNSAISALHRTRKLISNLVDEDTSNEQVNSSVRKSAEMLHELLDQVDNSIRECVDFVENDTESGLRPILDRVQSQFPQITIEFIDELINEWKFLSRKHNVSPYLLPKCHENYKDERYGTNHLRHSLLPQACSQENEALEKYRYMHYIVTNERENIAQKLSKAISEQYLPNLGFTSDTKFGIEISTSNDTISSASSQLLSDATDFLISGPSPSGDTSSLITSSIHDIASSGEKARILFAIECALPGSIGTACRPLSSTLFRTLDLNNSGIVARNSSDFLPVHEYESNSISYNEVERWYNYTSLVPITTIYDEIDAHIGGRAVKAMAQLLVQQSCRFQQQVVVITHNPTIAAAAQTHIIMEKGDPICTSSTYDAEKSNTTEAIVASSVNLTEAIEIAANNDSRNQVSQRKMHQSLSVSVIKNDPYNPSRIQELVRMVCGSTEDDDKQTTIPITTSTSHHEAKAFVRSLIRDSIENIKS
jgi:DNA repair ATPase RecN